MFEGLIEPQAHNTLAADVSLLQEDPPYESEVYEVDKTSQHPLPDDICKAFKEKAISVPEKTSFLTYINHQGLIYSTSDNHEGNSGVFFTNSHVPFSIQKILHFSNHPQVKGIWLVVRAHQVASISTDPYAKYPLLHARIWEPKLVSTVQVFPLHVVECHFAKCLIPWEEKLVAVILPLSRVSRLLYPAYPQQLNLPN